AVNSAPWRRSRTCIFTILDIPSQLAYKILVWIMKHGMPCSSNLRSRWMTLTWKVVGRLGLEPRTLVLLALKGERRAPLIWCWVFGHSSRTEQNMDNSQRAAKRSLVIGRPGLWAFLGEWFKK